MYEIFEKLLKDNNITPYKVSKATGIATATLSDWKNGKSTPKQEKLDKIANYFKIDPNIFSPNRNLGYCLECGNKFFMYGESEDYHEKEHEKWENAVKNFGFCWPTIVSERAKAIARNKLLENNLDFDKKFNANVEIFKALFSRSLTSNDYSLDHVDFNEYASMLLNQNQFKQKIERDIYNELVNTYGISDGINEGETYYHLSKEKVPRHTHTVAAHFDGDDYTEDELNEIKNFAEFIKQRRKKD